MGGHISLWCRQRCSLMYRHRHIQAAAVALLEAFEQSGEFSIWSIVSIAHVMRLRCKIRAACMPCVIVATVVQINRNGVMLVRPHCRGCCLFLPGIMMSCVPEAPSRVIGLFVAYDSLFPWC